MADNLTNDAEDLLLIWMNTNGAATRPTMPLKLALCTSAPTDSAAGTEVSGGSYARQSITTNAAGTTNTADIVYTNMPACTVTHVEVYDSAGTPKRLWHGALAASKTVNAGDTFTIPTGDLDMTLS